MSRSVVTVSSSHTAVRLASNPGSVTEARHLLHDDLRTRGMPSHVVNDALVVVTELMGNAVRHAEPMDGNGTVRLRWSVQDSQVRIEVTDGGGSERPHIPQVSLDSTGGRGLAIVRAIAADWGVVTSDRRVTVYAVVGG